MTLYYIDSIRRLWPSRPPAFLHDFAFLRVGALERFSLFLEGPAEPWAPLVTLFGVGVHVFITYRPGKEFKICFR